MFKSFSIWTKIKLQNVLGNSRERGTTNLSRINKRLVVVKSGGGEIDTIEDNIHTKQVEIAMVVETDTVVEPTYKKKNKFFQDYILQMHK